MARKTWDGKEAMYQTGTSDSPHSGFATNTLERGGYAYIGPNAGKRADSAYYSKSLDERKSAYKAEKAAGIDVGSFAEWDAKN